MIHESTVVLPVAVQLDQAVFAPAAESPAPPIPIPPSNSEEMRAVEAIFAVREQESKTVAGLLGLYTGAMLLHDLAIETFTEPVDEVEPEKKHRDDDDAPEPS